MLHYREFVRGAESAVVVMNQSAATRLQLAELTILVQDSGVPKK